MVGFGSSLRLARRSGWEGAYLDYETLKLLLSQIEAVYEEEGHRRGHHRNTSSVAATTTAPNALGGAPADVFVTTTTSTTSVGTAGGRSPPPSSVQVVERSSSRNNHHPPPSHHARNRGHSHHHHPTAPRKRKAATQTSTQAATKDFREELFLESDSDVAYLSVDCPEEENPEWMIDGDFPWNSEDDTDLEHPLHSNVPTQPFLLPYSHSDEEAEESQTETGCGAAMMTSWTNSWDGSGTNAAASDVAVAGNAPGSASKSSRKQRSKKRSRNFVIPPSMDEDEFYVQSTGRRTNSGTYETFFFTGNDDSNNPLYEDEAGALVRPSILNANLRRTSGSDGSALLPSATPAMSGSSLFTFTGGSLTPPRVFFASRPSLDVAHPLDSSMGDATISAAMQSPVTQPPMSAPPSTMTPSQHQKQQKRQQKKMEEQRRKERHQRRIQRRRVRRKREQDERKVPRHLRVAHAKSRAITERFLGLLRAETEKVMLFAQSRLGELADTAGSLRFPFYDDDYYGALNTSEHENIQGRYSRYPLSDGGRHPSASSSSDDAAGGNHQGKCPWSDSSSEDVEASHSGHPSVGGGGGSGTALSNPSKGYSNINNNSTNNMNALGGPMFGEENPRYRASPLYAGGSSTSASNSARKRNYAKAIEANKTILRKISHYEALRMNRPVFQRCDNILGEDLLFLSAVEEADGYTAVGVELMHVLRYICVNLIAVRKICRKHDRLLVNRMLGGYYHRARGRGNNTSNDTNNYERIEDAQTLGGLVARVSGEIYEAHPALIGQMNHYKLVGVYDIKIQKLANSRTVQVVSSCLALALSEYEIARSRADALTRLNSGTSMATAKRSGDPNFISVSKKDSRHGNKQQRVQLDSSGEEDQNDDETPNTASSISLTRLRFTVTSIFALREAARFKMNYYGTYLSRSLSTFTGHSVVGEGLDGCSRETLDFMVSFNPDAALLMDSSILFRGLKRGHWMRTPMSEVMTSTLAVSITPVNVTVQAALALLPVESVNISHMLSVVPESKNIMFKQFMKGQVPLKAIGSRILKIRDLGPLALRLNCLSCFLYSMNYYVVHPSTTLFVSSTQSPVAYTAVVIGAPNLAALIAAFVHIFVLSMDAPNDRHRVKSIRFMLVLSALAAFIGCGIHAMAVNLSSVQLAILGRFILGFGSAEILHRQLLMTTVVPSHLVTESMRLVHYRVLGMVCGLLFGSLTETLPIYVDSIGIRSLQSSSWAMMALWIVQMIALSVKFRMKDTRTALSIGKEDGGIIKNKSPASGNASDSSSSSEPLRTPQSVLYRSSSDKTDDSATASLTQTYGTMDHEVSRKVKANPSPRITGSAGVKNSSSGEQENTKKSGIQKFKTMSSRLRRLCAYHIGIPVSLLMIFFASYSLEVFFSASPIVTYKYFQWTGNHLGMYLGILSIMIFPLNFICEFVSRRYEERTVIRRSLLIFSASSVVMINYGALASLSTEVPDLLAKMPSQPSHPYDWRFGVFQYVLGMMFAVFGLTALRGAAQSLLSKVAPPYFRSLSLHVGTLSTLISLSAELLGNAHVVMVALSRLVIEADLVNSLVIPLLLVSLLLGLLVRKHFFFLM